MFDILNTYTYKVHAAMHVFVALHRCCFVLFGDGLRRHLFKKKNLDMRQCIYTKNEYCFYTYLKLIHHLVQTQIGHLVLKVGHFRVNSAAATVK